MNIVLVQPRGFSWTPQQRVEKVACVMPPVGLASIAAVLRRAGHRVSIIDGALNSSLTNDLLADRILAHRPAMVGFTATTSAFPDAYRLCRLVKERSDDVTTVFGGVHASWGKGELLVDYPAIDVVVAGEGETVTRLLAEGDRTSDRCFFRNGGAPAGGTRETPLVNIDDLPFPAYDLLDGFPKRYLSPLFSYPRAPCATVISSRGCIYRCSYCDRSVFGAGFRWNSPEYTFGQMERLYRDYGVRHVNFYDDLFTLNRPRVETLCRRLENARLPLTFNCIVRIGHIDRELIALLKRGGCFMVSVGIESGDQSFLDAHKAGLDLESVRRDVELLHENGLWVKGLFMMGFPDETESTIVRTRKFACSLPLKDANMTAFTPFPGAPITATIGDYGAFDNDWAKLDCVNFVFVPSGIASRRVLEHHRALFYRQFYTRPFMRRHVYPKLLFRSPHSTARLVRHARTFFSFRRELDRQAILQK
ncbi:MAG: B12-binding domain-containing radical SAM protein [Chitinispirillaceae bacterium]|nr:B12-binding domain-containing radical SAM protein [Chitinispirillaceae bacterium]